MKKSIAKIILILLVVILLPVFFYISEQVVSLNKNEQIVEDVFSKQLESILFSINQNTEDIIKQWGTQLSIPVESNSEIMKNIVSRLLENNPPIEKISFFDADTKKYISGYNQGNETVAEPFIPSRQEIEKLKDFQKNKYQKVESIQNGNKLTLYFLSFHSGHYILVQITIDPDIFIQQILRPKIQQVAQEMFYIQVEKRDNKQILFSTEESPSDPELLQSELWYLPGYDLGIRLKTKTLNEMVLERHRKQSYVLWILILVVFAGTFFLFRSIRNEIRLAEMKSEFVSNVSHEIRTPLSSISMYAETLLLKRVKDEKKKEEYLKTIHAETQRLGEMVNRILNFSRMEKNKRKYIFEEIDLNRLIENTLKSFEERFLQNNIHISVEKTTAPLLLTADQNALTEVMVNLIDNAVKYRRKENPRITVRTMQTKAEIIVDVEDNGIGISNKDKKYIFDKFYRVTQGNLALQAQGSGLGLNIVCQILKAHKASIQVNSKPGEGSTFRIKLKKQTPKNHE